MSDSDSPGPGDWQSTIAAQRLEVDREFHPELEASTLSRQSWELIMTAAEFEITDTEDPAEADLRVNLDRLDSVLSAIKRIEAEAGGSTPSVGLLDRLLGVIRPSQRTSPYAEEAERLAEEYASRLHEELLRTGQWERVVSMASVDAGDD